MSATAVPNEADVARPAHRSPSDARAATSRDVAIIALAAALIAGLAHVAIAYWRPLLEGALPLGYGRDLVWMAPLSYALWFAAAGIVISALVALSRQRLGLGFLAGTYAFLVLLAALLLFPAIQQYASILLALGVGAQVGRAAASRPLRARLFARRAAVVVGGLIVAASVVTIGTRVWSTRRAMAALPDPPSGAPNVLLIILDTVRASRLSLYGYPRATTPELNRLATESVVFDRAIATAPWTLPTHGTLFSGRYAGRLSGGLRAPIRESDVSLAQYFARHGYATGGFVANLAYTTYETGLSRGFATYDDFPRTVEQVVWSSSFSQTALVSSIARSRRRWQIRVALQKFDLRVPSIAEKDRKRAPVVTREFLRWQQTVGHRPFFAFLNLFDAHAPYQPPPPYDKRFSATPSDADWYDGAIAYMDDELARLFAELAARGVLDHTLVVVASDHGEHLGEWGLHEHANSVYPPVIEVPLLIRYPGRVPAGVRITTPVSLRDVAHTIAALALPQEPHVPFPGVSLAQTWTGEGLPPSPAVAERHAGQRLLEEQPEGHVAGLFDGDMEYIRSADGSEQLFDLRRLAHDSTNLAFDPTQEPVLRTLRARLDSATGDAYRALRPPADRGN